MSEHRRLGSVLGWALLTVCLGVMLWSAWPRTTPETTAYAASGRLGLFDAPAMPDGFVDVNLGEMDELGALTGVGETLAQAIIDERTLHGRFFYPEDLLSVHGIGEKKLAGFREQLDMRGE